MKNTLSLSILSDNTLNKLLKLVSKELTAITKLRRKADSVELRRCETEILSSLVTIQKEISRR